MNLLSRARLTIRNETPNFVSQANEEFQTNMQASIQLPTLYILSQAIYRNLKLELSLQS